jgi:hypothetical protein
MSMIFCPSSVNKKLISDFWDLNQGPKSHLQSSCHSTTSQLPPSEAMHFIYHHIYSRQRDALVTVLYVVGLKIANYFLGGDVGQKMVDKKYYSDPQNFVVSCQIS